MNRKLKGLSLALVASLALSGVVAAAAHAETKFESTLAAPAITTVDVTNDTNEHGKLVRFTIGNGARFVECTSVKVSGIAFAGTATALIGTPEFADCFSNGLTTAPITVTHNGCKLKITVRTTSLGEFTGEGCSAVEIHLYESAKHQEENKPICTYDIAMPQTVSGVKFKNAGGTGTAMDITAELSGATKLKEVTNTGPGGLAVCGLASGAKGEGAFAGNLRFAGTTSGGAAAGVTLATASVDTPVESTLAAPAETILDVNDVTGSEDGKLARLTIGSGTRYVECTQARQLSNAQIIGTATAVSATPKYETCFSNGVKTAIATVAHNGCTLKLTARKELESKVLGDATIECAEGKQIELNVFENEKTHAENKPLCIYDVKGGQTLTGAEITVAGSGETADLALNLSTLSKLKLTNTGPGGLASCGIAAGAEGTGAFSGKITVSGTNTSGTQVGVKLG